jgi:hypothetical protein
MKEHFSRISAFFREIPGRFRHTRLFNLLAGVRNFLSAAWKKIKVFLKTSVRFTPPTTENMVSFVLRWWHWLLGGLFAFLILYYPVGALLIHRIDVNPGFSGETAEDSPKTVATLSALINREVNEHVWTPSLPFIFPSAILDNMPGYQTGIMDGIRRTVDVLAARNPESDDLKKAVAALAYPGTTWYVAGWQPTVSAQRSYQNARTDLTRYEEKIAEGTAAFSTDPATLSALLTSLSDGLKGNAETIRKQVSKYEKRLFDMQADDVFYNVKGQVYVSFLVLRDIREDFKDAFENDAVRWLWLDAEASLRQALMIQPLFVTNGSPETQFMPNHLLALGFYLTHARADIQEMRRLLD